MTARPLFELSESPLDISALAASIGGDGVGAYVSFEGRVRNVNDGRSVVGLEYEAHRPLCMTEGEAIVREALGGVIAARCVHRVGHLALGEVAVWVGVVAVHRDEAFRACRYIIDEVKRRLPIWKKESYAGGGTTWIGSEEATPALASLVLAGGMSVRMGRDKATLAYEGEPQVRRIARLLERIAPPVWVSVRSAQLGEEVFAGLRLLADQDEGIGPLGGILAAFHEDPARAWLVVAVDMPFLSEAAIRGLVDSRDAGCFATAFRNREVDGPEPVCAIYEPRILPVLQERRRQHRHSLQVLRDLPVKLVDPVRAEEIRNINFPDEYRAAAREEETRRVSDR